mgnify:CR=1 FL=1
MMSTKESRAKTAERKKKQSVKRKTVDETLDSEWLPVPSVTIDVDDPFKQHCKYLLVPLLLMMLMMLMMLFVSL